MYCLYFTSLHCRHCEAMLQCRCLSEIYTDLYINVGNFVLNRTSLALSTGQEKNIGHNFLGHLSTFGTTMGQDEICQRPCIRVSLESIRYFTKWSLLMHRKLSVAHYRTALRKDRTIAFQWEDVCRNQYIYIGSRIGAVGWGTAPQAGRSQVRFQMVSLEFFIDIILPATLWPRGWLSLWQKWVPGIFSGWSRQPVCRADNLTTFMCRLPWNLGASTSWNPQGLSRPVMGLLYLYMLI